MPAKIFGPRKRRTRQHVIADQGVHHVEGFILDEGHTAERFLRDYGYDLQMTTYDNRGFVEPGLVYFQVKAMENLKKTNEYFVFDLDIRDYNLWIHEQTPVILVVYDVAWRKAYWQNMQSYFLSEETARPKKGAKWVRVYFTEDQQLGGETMAELRNRKNKRRI